MYELKTKVIHIYDDYVNVPTFINTKNGNIMSNSEIVDKLNKYNEKLNNANKYIAKLKREVYNMKKEEVEYYLSNNKNFSAKRVTNKENVWKIRQEEPFMINLLEVQEEIHIRGYTMDLLELNKDHIGEYLLIKLNPQKDVRGL